MSLVTSKSLPTLLLAVLGAVSLNGCGVGSVLDYDTTERTEDRAVPADGIHLVHVDTGSGAIEIRGGADDEITIRSVFREHDHGDGDATINVEDDRLVITGNCDGGRLWNRCSVGFVVTVPPEVDVRVATDNGRVQASDLTGDVSIETDNGRVHASDLTGDVSIETDNGAIAATELGGAAVVTETDNGKIHLTFAEAPGSVEALTNNGSITIRLPDDGSRYAVDAHSDNGKVDIDVGTDPDTGRPLDVESDNGRIDIGYRSP